MEISRRYLQPLEEREMKERMGGLLEQDQKDYFAQIEQGQHDAELERMKDQMVEMSGGAIDRELIRVQTQQTQLDAAEMQRQVDGLTRNQRRVLNKRMRKAGKK